MRRLALLLLAGLLLATPTRGAETATPDDTARFLAGLPAPAGSAALAGLRSDRGWQVHAAALGKAFDGIERRSLGRIRTWAAAAIPSRRPVLYYMFSGPDFLFANSFFPDADTYVLSGLEPVGAVPDLGTLPRASVQRALPALQASMRSLLSISFFLTNSMRTQLRATPLQGTLPVLYVFLARSGKTIRDVTPVSLSETGEVTAGPSTRRGAPQGVRITFAGAGGREQTLYYFSTNLADDGFRNGFAQFCDRLGQGDAFAKSASYLMHSPVFSQVREFLLTHASTLLQDDTGIPAAAFDATWKLTPYGRYLGPIGLFAGRYQPRLAQLFRRGAPNPIEFGLGYRWRPSESNLLLAVKQTPPPAAPQPAAAPAVTPAPAPPAAAPPAAAPPAETPPPANPASPPSR